MASDVATVRLKLAEIVMRAETDEAFRKSLAADQSTVLADNGIPAGAVDEYSRAISRAVHEDATDDPMCVHTAGCRDFTCFSSGCPYSCYVSILIDRPDNPPDPR